MKILHVIDSGGFYGAEAMLVELALEQIKEGHSVTVCSIGTPNQSQKPLEKVCYERGVDVFPLRMKAGFNLFGGMDIVRYAKEHKFDLLHSHGYKGNILLGVLPKLVRRLPLVSTMHGWTSTKVLSKIWIYEALESALLSRIDAIVFVSEAMAQRKGLANRDFRLCEIIPNGIGEMLPQTANDDDVVKMIQTMSESGPVIGSIGRLSFEKGYDILLSAFAQVQKTIGGAKLVILGDGRLIDDLKQSAVELGIAESVWFAGYIENANRYIGLFDVYVNSSRTEGTPITLLESMRAETPIVAARVGGNTALIDAGSCGVVFDISDVEALPSKICEVIQDSDFSKQIVENAKTKFLNEYSSRKMMSKYEQLYKELI